MARLLWLPDVLRSAGLTVHEQPGWRTRGSDDFAPQGVIIHETQGSRTSTDAGEISVLLNGSASAPPPIAQLYLSRSGQWWVIASGRCNHALTGRAGPLVGVGNRGLVGIEAQHAQGEAWTRTQYDSYARGVAALIRHQPGWRIAGHKEHQPGEKSDPGFDMNLFRTDVAGVLAGRGDDMGFVINFRPGGSTTGQSWDVTDGQTRRPIVNWPQHELYVKTLGWREVIATTQADRELWGGPWLDQSGDLTDEELAEIREAARQGALEGAEAGSDVSTEELEAAAEVGAERAIRETLGGLDEPDAPDQG